MSYGRIQTSNTTVFQRVERLPIRGPLGERGLTSPSAAWHGHSSTYRVRCLSLYCNLVESLHTSPTQRHEVVWQRLGVHFHFSHGTVSVSCRPTAGRGMDWGKMVAGVVGQASMACVGTRQTHSKPLECLRNISWRAGGFCCLYVWLVHTLENNTTNCKCIRVEC